MCSRLGGWRWVVVRGRLGRRRRIFVSSLAASPASDGGSASTTLANFTLRTASRVALGVFCAILPVLCNVYERDPSTAMSRTHPGGQQPPKAEKKIRPAPEILVR